MKLTEYLTRYEIGKKEFAANAGICEMTLYQLLNGNTIKLPTAAKIQRATYNKVTCMELYEEFMEDLEKSKK